MKAPQNRSSTTDLVFYAGPPAFLVMVAICDQWTDFAKDIAGLPFVISIFVLGLPHGAIDWRLAAEHAGARSFLSRVRSFVTYLIGMLIMLGLCLTAPIFAIGVFGLMSAWHFGLADERDLEERFPTPLRQPRQTFLAAFSRGTLLLALPFAASPTSSLQATSRLSELLGTSLLIRSAENTQHIAIVFVSASMFGLVLAVVHRFRCHGYPALRTELLELGSIFYALLVLPPLFGMGIYFLCWHSWRHWRRIALSGTSAMPSGITILRNILLGHRDSLVLLVPTLLALALLAGWRLESWNLTDVALLSIAVFLVVTPSHDWLIQKVFDGRSAVNGMIRPVFHQPKKIEKSIKPGTSPLWNSPYRKVLP